MRIIVFTSDTVKLGRLRGLSRVDDDRITCSACRNCVPVRKWAFGEKTRIGCRVDKAWIDPGRLRRCKDYVAKATGSNAGSTRSDDLAEVVVAEG